MKLGIVSGEYPPMQGGVGDYTRELAKALALGGHEVHILAPVASESTNLPPACTLHPMIERWGWSTARVIRRWASKLGLQVINLQYQAAAFRMHPAINLLPRRLAGSPLVVTFHDLNVPYLFPKAGWLRWWAILTLARRAAAVIVTNREDHDRLGLQPMIIPIGSNIAPEPPKGFDRTAWRARWQVQPNDFLIGYFGFLNKSKGGEDLIETFHRLNRLTGTPPTKLLMIGGRTGSSDVTNQAYAAQIDQLITERELYHLIMWTGYTSPAEVSASLLSVDACLLPYRDGVSFRRGSFMAALAHGCPIITTTPRVELPELRHRENVLLAPAAAPVAFAQAVVTLQQDPALRHRLAAGARSLARSFRWETIAQTTAQVFDSLTG